MGEARTVNLVPRIIRWSVAGALAAGAAVGIVLFLNRAPEPPPQEAAETIQSEALPVEAPALPGADATFHGGTPAVFSNGAGHDIATDSQDRIVVLGRTGVDHIPRSAVWRLLPGGKPDLAFGSGGVALVPSAFTKGTVKVAEFGEAVAVDAEDRILIAGYLQDRQGRLHMSVVRLTAAGAMDPAFHATGRMTLAGSAGPDADDAAKAIVIDPKGKIVVAGSSWPLPEEGRGPHEFLALWRLTGAGDLDRTFHGTGVLTVPETRGNALAVDRQGRILAAGATQVPRADWSLAVWRFLSDGSADPAWHDGEVFMPELQASSFVSTAATGLAVDPVGRVLVLGTIYDRRRLSDVDDNGIQTLGVWRLTPDGSPDAEYGRSPAGLVMAVGTAGGRGAKAGDTGRTLVADAQGRTVVAGASRDAQGRRLLTVWRRTVAGLPDPALGRRGASVQSLPPEADEGPNAVAVGAAADRQGRTLITGSVRVGDKVHLAVWRIKP